MEKTVKENLEKISYLINEAKSKSKYNQDVKLIAVSKTVDVDKVAEAADFGIMDFGENKPQELLRKAEVFPSYNWHQIGTLQKNKVKHIIDKVKLIHSLDSVDLAKEIDKRAKDKDITIQCLIQINISKEESKHGLDENSVVEFVKQVSENYKNIIIKGLMGMAPYEVEKENTRIYFKKMKELMSLINSKNINGVILDELSMGMSNDYQIAIEEGATMVRLGTLIFGERIYNKNI
ncbi:YggS family pyridoxal phosphate enzyme [Peptoanaerobacter stomatis]|uniref:Pyridoxal phosphate homeostasis protein n=2 Tax=Peptoanaerobacter stomatis TaxID=796937 RepID=J4W176_9FIRM|nr:YggS family pyridoxal phosphate enzyme [Peptoanaerobacter stomatis]EJU20031.1 pyridoxal phosphate enzyme, YggS family [Peptoanaerobacter stomatis]